MCESCFKFLVQVLGIRFVLVNMKTELLAFGVALLKGLGQIQSNEHL